MVSSKTTVLASHEFSLANRYPEPWVNEVFKDNILLTLAYLKNGTSINKPIDWNQVRKPGRFYLTLTPNETFAFHDLVSEKYQKQKLVTTSAHFNATDGFRSDGFLFGDGVCHLASLLGWVARDSGLTVEAPTNHDFRPIPQVPREFGVSIYSLPTDYTTSAIQNLYITNNKDHDVSFVFDYSGEVLKIESVK
ncbi:hypothetical protein A3A59_06575 [Candidatus Gottesmanbacteria bacterium RIFCSPLOWO2_01_FULL_42_10]|nr:MAG: hypothetical protein A3A59_06575 [Candidatus Gottesmanbacteria bacterium RIFCSPLOWO2_01_FULL_42_10]